MARPREFNVEEAIGIATELFSERGYHATSISDLTDALGILRGSLYKVFPDKHSLLLTALDRYRIAQLDHFRRALNQPGSAVDGLRSALTDWAIQCSGSKGHRGCLITQLTQEMIPGDVGVTDRIQRHFQQLGELFEETLERMQFEGTLPPGASIPVLAQLLLATVQGLRAIGKHAPPLAQMQEICETWIRLVTNQSQNLSFSATAT